MTSPDNEARELEELAAETARLRQLARRRLSVAIAFYKSMEEVMMTATQQIFDALDALDVSDEAEHKVVQAALTLLKARPNDQEMTQIATRLGARKAAEDAEAAEVQAALDAQNASGSGATGGDTGTGSTGGDTTPPADTTSDTTGGDTAPAEPFNPNTPARG